MLAAKLCHLQSLKALIAHRANANAECDGWSGITELGERLGRCSTVLITSLLLNYIVVQEAVSTGDRDILTAVLEVRDLQRHIQRTSHVPALLQRLKDTPDFYVEMKWEFTSWGESLTPTDPSNRVLSYQSPQHGSN